MENEQEPCKQLYEKRLNAFYEPLPQAVEEVRGVFSKFDLTQKQAACVTACALNQMTNVEGQFPVIATVALTSALRNAMS